MPRRKKEITYAKKGEKALWHPYGLQDLRADKFVYVVDRILCGRFVLLDLRFNSSAQSS